MPQLKEIVHKIIDEKKLIHFKQSSNIENDIEYLQRMINVKLVEREINNIVKRINEASFKGKKRILIADVYYSCSIDEIPGFWGEIVKTLKSEGLGDHLEILADESKNRTNKLIFKMNPSEQSEKIYRKSYEPLVSVGE